MALEAQWQKTPPLCFSAHAIAVYLGALEAPKVDNSQGRDRPDDLNFDNDEIDADDPDFVDFLQKLTSSGM